MPRSNHETRRTLVVLDGGLPSLVALWLATMSSAGSRSSGLPGEHASDWVVGYLPAFVKFGIGQEGWPGGRVSTEPGVGEGRVANARVVAAREAARLCGCQLIEASTPMSNGSSSLTGADPAGDWWHVGRNATAMLVEAIGVAMGGEDNECWEDVVWPVQVPPESANALDRIAAALDRAMLLARLDAVDSEETRVIDAERSKEDQRRMSDGSGTAVVIQTPMIDLRDEQVVDLALDVGVPLRAMLERRISMACVWNERWARAYRGVTSGSCTDVRAGHSEAVTMADFTVPGADATQR